MKYLRKEHFVPNCKPLTYEALLQTNGGYAGSSGSSGGGSGYSSSSGSSCGNNSKNNTTTRFIRSDKYTKTYGTKNTDNTETVTTIDIKTGKVISRYTYGISKGTSSKGSSYASRSSSKTHSYGYSALSMGIRHSSSYQTTSGGGYTVSYEQTSSGANGTNPGSSTDTQSEEKPITVKKYGYQICADENQSHCDIIAWNHAVDAGLNPAGDNNDAWDGNKMLVDEIFNRYYADEATEFDSNLAGKKGYIFYDWTGDGTYDHMEYCEVDANGAGYNFYLNEGKINEDAQWVQRLFSRDKNAHAKADSTGTIKFVALN